MKNKERYLSEGRSDPYSPQQMSEHPYDFVSDPQKINRRKINIQNHHDKINNELLTGRVTIEGKTITEIYSGSGNYKKEEFNKIKTLVKEFVCVGNKPVILGSSLKGTIRSIFEAATYSCFRCFSKKQNYGKGDKLPQAIKNKLKITTFNLKLDDKLNENIKGCSGDLLCPACSLFGAMNYYSRVKFNDAKFIDKVETIIKETKEAEEPQLHRAAISINPMGNDLIIKKIEGRKMYYDTSQKFFSSNSGGNELCEFINKNSKFEFDIVFENLIPEELGGLLWSAGILNDFILRLGGLKSYGYGKVETKVKSLKLKNGLFETDKDISECRQYIDKFFTWDNFYENGKKEIIEITRKVKP